MTVSLWQDRSSETRYRTDFLVVGAGLSGASTAYWLTQRNEKRVMVVDAGDLAGGASGSSAGMLLLGTADPYSRVVDLFGREHARTVVAFTRDNRALLEQHMLGDDPDALRLLRTGTVRGAISEHELSEVRRSCALLNEDGFEHRFLDGDAMKDAFGHRYFHGGSMDPAGVTLDPARLTERIMGRAVDAGARFFAMHPVFELSDHESGVTVRTAKATFECEMVLLCTNGYSPLLHSHLEGRVVPTRGQMLATEPLETRVTPFGVYADFGYEYFWQLPTGELVAGGWRQHSKDAEKGYSDEITSVIQEGIGSFLEKVFPQLGGVRVTHRWAGVMGFAGDGFPFIGELPGRPRIKYVGGYTGHGLGFSFHCAKKLVALALEGDSVGWLSARRATLTKAAGG